MKTRTRRRSSTRSADQDVTVCAMASAMKPEHEQVDRDHRRSARRRTMARRNVQLTKLKAATASQMPACQPAQPESIVKQRAREQPEHHDIAGRERNNRRTPQRPRAQIADAVGHGMRRRSQREGNRKPAGHSVADVAEQRACQHQQHGDGRGAQGEIEGGRRHQISSTMVGVGFESSTVVVPRTRGPITTNSLLRCSSNLRKRLLWLWVPAFDGRQWSMMTQNENGVST